MSTRKTPVLKIAPAYDDDLIRLIEQEFSNKLGEDIKFEVIPDPSILCGFIAYIHGVVYDVSGKTQLSSIGKYLVESIVIPPRPPEKEDIL